MEVAIDNRRTRHERPGPPAIGGPEEFGQVHESVQLGGIRNVHPAGTCIEEVYGRVLDRSASPPRDTRRGDNRTAIGVPRYANDGSDRRDPSGRAVDEELSCRKVVAPDRLE